jgi:PHD/YefM family antitoxin component YafN of YafNO toxin-antitoxin module
MSAMTLKIIGEKTTVAKIGKRDVVLLPLTRYQTLMKRLEDLEDILDSQRSIAEYRAGQGRTFSDYLKERRGKRRVSGSKRGESTYKNFE